jgi:hypothetical protein
MALECKCHLDENRHAIWTNTINNFSCVKPSRSAADLPRRNAYFTARPETAASRGFYPIPRSFKGLKSQKAP